MQRTGTTNLIPHRSPVDPTGPTGRLAELVAHLSGCPASRAVDAVERSLPDDDDDLRVDDRLAVVAHAMLLLKREIDLRDRRHRRTA